MIFYLILLKKRKAHLRNPPAKEIRVWVHLRPGELQIVAECWEPIGFMQVFTAAIQRDAMVKVTADCWHRRALLQVRS